MIYTAIPYLILSCIPFIKRKTLLFQILFSSIIFYLTYHKYSYDNYTFLVHLFLFFFLQMVMVIDFRSKKIPNRYILSILLILIVFVVNKYLHTKEIWILIMPFIRMFCFFAGFYLIYLLSRKGIGGGDVKLLGVLALMFSGYQMLLLLLFSSLLALFYIACLYGVKKIKSKKDKIAFGPFICIVFFVMCLCL